MSSLYTDPQQLHDDLIDHIIFGDWSIEEFSEHFDENVSKDTHQTVIMRVTSVYEKNQGRLAMYQTLVKIKVDMRITTTYPIYHG